MRRPAALRCNAPARLGRSAALALSLGVASCAGPAFEPVLLHSVRTETRAAVDLERGLRVAVYVDDPEALAQQLSPRAVEARAPDHVVLRLDRYPGRLTGSRAAYLASTFVIDHRSPEVLAMAEQIEAELGADVTPEQLVGFVQRAIEPSLGRGFDLASQIARIREGDCTEHAVLFAALARHFGHPARVVQGVVLVTIEGRIEGFGHAWNEVHEAGAWRPIDASPLETMVPIAYVPSIRLENEGPAYLAAVASRLRLMPERLEVLGNVEPEGSN